MGLQRGRREGRAETSAPDESSVDVPSGDQSVDRGESGREHEEGTEELKSDREPIKEKKKNGKRDGFVGKRHNSTNHRLTETEGR